MENKNRETITAKELAELWGVSVSTIGRWAELETDPLPSEQRTPFTRHYYKQEALEWHARLMQRSREE